MVFERIKPDSLLQLRLTQVGRYCAVSVLIIGILALAGWQWNIDLLKRPASQLTPINPTTALNFILAALSYLCLAPAGVAGTLLAISQKKKILAGRILAVIILLLGLLKFVGLVYGISFPFQLSLMATSAASCFILIGLSLLLLNTTTKTGQVPAQYLALAISMMGLFSMVGYLYHVHAFYGVFRFTPMAIYAAGCFLLISASLLLSNPGAGIMKEFTSSHTGGLTARTLLPVVILLPIVFGYLRLLGYWQGLFSVEFGVTLLVLSIVLIFVLLIGYNTRLLNKRDAQKMASENTLQESEERYRLLVSSVKDYAIFMVDPSGYIMSWNEGATRIKGYETKEIIGKHISVFYTEEEVFRDEPTYNLAQARMHGSFKTEGLRVRKDGLAFWASIIITALYDPKGDLMGFTKVTRDVTEKKKAEDQITYMAQLMEDTSDAIFSTDAAFNIRTWNKAAELLFGYSQAEVKGRSAIDALRSPLDEKMRLSIRAEMKNAGHWKGEVDYLNKDDSVLTILLSASAVKDAKGKLDGFVMVCRDFTERKKMEQQLHTFNNDLKDQVFKKTAELTGIFERITDAFIAMDKNLCYTYLNKKAGELIHRDPASLIGKWVWDVFPDAIGSETYLSFNKSMAEQKYMTSTDYYPPLGLWQENHLYPSPDGLSVFIRDITEKKKREKELTDYKYALDQSSIVSITDHQGKITYVNDNFCRISKYAPEELLGQSYRLMNSDFHSAGFIDRMWKTISSGKVWKGEFRNIAKDGSIYWVDMTIVPFLNDKNEPYEYMALDSDITVRKKAESLLYQSYEDIRQLASHLQDIREEERAGIAREIHDELGQQLTGIKMDLSWISKRITGQGENDEVRQKVKGTLDLLDITIKTVRRIATELRPSILDDLGLIAAIEWQSQEFQKRSEITTTFVSNMAEFDCSPAIAIGLFRICQESLTNIARHAEAGKVTITLQDQGNESILLKIEDDGKGFQQDKIGTKKTLGLLGMKERVLMIGGEFELTSQPGKGTSLSVTVPLNTH